MIKSINYVLPLLLVSLLIGSCESNKKTTQSNKDDIVNSKYSIASAEYEELVAEALNHIEKFEFVELGHMVSDDIEYYLPDGGEESRTRFIGKEAFMNFWNTYQDKTGLDNWTVTNVVSFPFQIHNKLAYSNIDGIAVSTYFSLNLKFGEQETDIRANWAFHFNEDKKIDKLYTYYDRTPIIEAAQLNVLKLEL
ncbi:MAG: hypothetical protein AB8B52_13170 [Winogradskyella sp.]|uniref:hypothetical protein n=1 Tax=Winogradskyella sp. TaxID=1883156 RepID=UPI00385E759F